jgi:hypothetical protein
VYTPLSGSVLPQGPTGEGSADRGRGHAGPGPREVHIQQGTGGGVPEVPGLPREPACLPARRLRS